MDKQLLRWNIISDRIFCDQSVKVVSHLVQNWQRFYNAYDREDHKIPLGSMLMMATTAQGTGARAKKADQTAGIAELGR